MLRTMPHVTLSMPLGSFFKLKYQEALNASLVECVEPGERPVDASGLHLAAIVDGFLWDAPMILLVSLLETRRVYTCRRNDNREGGSP